MIRPEPDQPLDEADIRVQRRVDARLHLLEEILLWQVGRLLLGRRGSAGLRRLRLHGVLRGAPRGRSLLLGLALGNLAGLARGAEIEGNQRCKTSAASALGSSVIGFSRLPDDRPHWGRRTEIVGDGRRPHYLRKNTYNGNGLRG